MAGIMFPDFVGTIAKVSGIENAQAQRDWMDEDRASKKAAAPFVQKALQGDQAALGEIATRHPDTFMKIAPLLERMDAGKRAKVKEDADFITQNGMAILNAPPEAQPQIYARVRQEAEASGRNVSQWPTQYDPGWVKFNVDKAMPFAEHFKRSGEGVTFAPPAGGGAGGDPAKAIGGIESGGRYDAVGPAANAQGQRAYGKYQVMDFNVGPWTAEILGKAMTPQEFLANPQAQDAVFNAKFGQYVKQHGSPEAAARAWFAGPGGMNNPNAKDVLGTSVAGYEKKFTAGMGGPSGAPPGMAVGADMPPADASGTPLPPAQQALQPLRGLQIPQGARVALQGGVPIVKDGNVLYLDANGGWGAVPLPSRAEPKTEVLPPGFRWNADRTAQEFIPGGPADPAVIGRVTEAKRKSDEKAIPQTITKGVQENLDALKEVDRALVMLEKTPSGVGGAGSIAAAWLPGAGTVQNWIDKDGVDIRAKIANIGSLLIHQRSGAAVSASEFPRLKPFVPTISDDPETVKKKLTQFRQVYDEVIRDTLEYYGPTNGFREYTPATGYMNKGQPEQMKVGGPAEQGKALFEARDAISKGAPREAVIERLTKMGVDPSGL